LQLRRTQQQKQQQRAKRQKPQKIIWSSNSSDCGSKLRSCSSRMSSCSMPTSSWHSSGSGGLQNANRCWQNLSAAVLLLSGELNQPKQSFLAFGKTSQNGQICMLLRAVSFRRRGRSWQMQRQIWAWHCSVWLHAACRHDVATTAAAATQQELQNRHSQRQTIASMAALDQHVQMALLQLATNLAARAGKMH
jgi:hypothetical protein